MVKKWILLLIFAYIILVAPAAMAAAPPLEVSMEPAKITTKPNTIAVFSLTITNNLGQDDAFLIRTYGSRLEWKIPGDVLFEVANGESKTTDMVFYTGERESTHNYDIKVFSRTIPGMNKSARITLTVSKPPEIMITSLDAAVEGNSLAITAGLESSVKKTFDVTFNLKDSEEIVMSTFSVSREIDGEDTVSETISLEDLNPGSYILEAVVGEDKETKGFSIYTVRDVEEAVVTTPNLLYDEIKITVYNKGNTVENDYTVSYTFPSGDYLTGFMTQPDECHDVEDGKRCTFIITGLSPTDSREIIFRMEYWPSYTRFIAAILVILAAGTIYLRRFGKPRIRKSYISKSKNMYHVIIEIKAPNKNLSNAVVRDWVSPLAHVDKDGFKHAKPVVRKSEAGTELIWRLGDIIAKEERILSYKIKTIVQGHLKMPKAYIRFMNKKGERVRVNSGHIEIR